MKSDIKNLDDIKKMVDTFYLKIREDEILASIFNDKIQDRWPTHLEKMYVFWETILLDKHSYQGSPFAPHVKMELEKEHFDKWITLFQQTIDQLFDGPKAFETKWRAEKMAEMFLNRLTFNKQNPHIKLV